MTESSPRSPDPKLLVEIPPHEVAELIAIALTITKGAALKGDAARAAFGVVGDRLAAYFREAGIMVMRPPPRAAHSSNPRAGRSDALEG